MEREDLQPDYEMVSTLGNDTEKCFMPQHTHCAAPFTGLSLVQSVWYTDKGRQAESGREERELGGGRWSRGAQSTKKKLNPNMERLHFLSVPPFSVLSESSNSGTMVQLTVSNVLLCFQDVNPHSDGDNLSDTTNASDPLSGGGLDDTPSVRRSVSFKERRNTGELETLTKRRNSDIDLQVGSFITARHKLNSVGLLLLLLTSLG